MKRKRFYDTPKTKRKKILLPLFILFILGVIFIPGPNGLVKVIYKNYRKQRLHREIEQLKIKAELIEAKISRGNDEQYMHKYLEDNYNMVPKDSAKK